MSVYYPWGIQGEVDHETVILNEDKEEVKKADIPNAVKVLVTYGDVVPNAAPKKRNFWKFSLWSRSKQKRKVLKIEFEPKVTQVSKASLASQVSKTKKKKAEPVSYVSRYSNVSSYIS
jgi:hypothetical protein